MSPADGAATLSAFTAASIARAREHFPDPATMWVICGGGRHNKTLMRELRARVNADVLSAEDAGWRGDFIEAEALCLSLAVRSLYGLPLSLPTTTGVQQPMTGGKLFKRYGIKRVSPHILAEIRIAAAMSSAPLLSPKRDF